MKREKFEKILDQVVDEWVMAADLPGQGIRLKSQSDIEGAFPVVLKTKKCYITCSWCGEEEIKGKTFLRSLEKPYEWRAKCLDCKETRFIPYKKSKRGK